MSKHTSGPWRVKTSGSEDDFVTRSVHGARSPGGDEVAFVTTGSYNDDVEAANARLIAAAPELLAALSELVACVKGGGSDADTWQALRDADAAIAKAEGK